MSSYERGKGIRIEREIVELHKRMDVFAERVPLSGASRYQGNGADVDIYPFGRDEKSLKAEIKGRANGAGFTMLERWLANYDMLFLRRDRQEPLVVLPWSTYQRLMLHVTEQICRVEDHSIDTLRASKSEQGGAISERPE
jgi:hypothetical protein